MQSVHVNPAYQNTLRQAGLVTAADFLNLSGVIVSGHPNRHVLRLELPGGLRGYLKKEHRVPWKDRWTNAWDGFGFVSKAAREGAVLAAAAAAGIDCPQVLAHGSMGKQAFLLMCEQAGTDLRLFLSEHPDQTLHVARNLGKAVAAMHAAGFEHRDLYAKHVLVGPGLQLGFLDWQRARRHARVSRAQRFQDLATLHATLLPSLMTAEAWWACLTTYVELAGGLEERERTAAIIRGLSAKLQRKKRIQELRRLPLPVGTQNLIWLRGEALCVTAAFREELSAPLPHWLRCRPEAHASCQEESVMLPRGGHGLLVRRTVTGLGRWLASWWQKYPAPEVERAALLFRLERHGVSGPRLLAFGHQRSGLGKTFSLLLTEARPDAVCLREALSRSSCREGRKLFRVAGALVRRLHEAGYGLGEHVGDFADICCLSKTQDSKLSLTRVDGLRRRNLPWQNLMNADLSDLLNNHPVSRSDALRFILGYLRSARLMTESRSLVRVLLENRERKALR